MRFISSILVAVGCGGTQQHLDTAEVLSPSNCVECHPTHVAQWRNSTHASSGTDPVFAAIFAALLLHEHLGGLQAVGCVLP